MREFLFRAKRNDNGEWVYWNFFGELCRESGKRTRLAVQKGATISYYDYIHQIVTLIDKNTICQFTGLFDKNGQKIWENDICQYVEADECGMKIEPFIIRYGRYAEMFKINIGFFIEWIKTSYYRCDLGFWIENRNIDVIGNVFDNAELLEE